ncbi:ras-like GTP-binding protein rhoA [Aplysia californica]|uniref:Ras-like GTP-binding protein rhoA n=1 Tax=Aplysia californica TaxID=6500 RepID=A0ABM0KAC2_APLCA|nr:ras-like GTP-binding protein rhoA [Aplysia californica]
MVFGRSKSQRYRAPDGSLSRKLVVIGDSMVGKTRLVNRFVTGDYSEEFTTTMLDTLQAKVPYDSTDIHLTIYDTAGQPELIDVRRSVYPATDVILLCFDISSPDSFNNISDHWRPELQQIRKYTHCPLILVGNKHDLRGQPMTSDGAIRAASGVSHGAAGSEGESEGESLITYEEGKSLAHSLGAYAYLECSSKTGAHVREVFRAATLVAMQHKRFKKSRMPGCLPSCVSSAH